LDLGRIIAITDADGSPAGVALKRSGIAGEIVRTRWGNAAGSWMDFAADAVLRI